MKLIDIWFTWVNLFIYINRHKNLQEDFKARFKDLLNMEIPEWIIFSFDVQVENENLETFLKRFHWNDFWSWSKVYVHI